MKTPPIDPWGYPYFYIKTNNNFEVFTLGSDNKFGGEGEAEDIFQSSCGD